MAKYRPYEFDTRENWMFDVENCITYLSLSPHDEVEERDGWCGGGLNGLLSRRNAALTHHITLYTTLHSTL